jgi:RNA polymerase-binding protein DksA
MSELNKSQIQALRAQLDQRQSQLREEIRNADADQAEETGNNAHADVEDVGEQGEQLTRDAVRFAETERDAEELREIAAAKERMEQGHYGECVDCGIDIPLARLQAKPASARCIKCQETFEITHPVRARIWPTA